MSSYSEMHDTFSKPIDDDPAELIEESRELLELVAESGTEAGETARKLLDYADSEGS